MFLNQLSDVQQKTFLALAMKLIRADKVTDPREEKAFLAMRQEMGIWQETRLPQGSVEDLAAAFHEKGSQGIVMLELIGLVFADERYQKQEQQLLRGLAKIFALDEQVAEQMENWVIRHRALMKEVQQFIPKQAS